MSDEVKTLRGRGVSAVILAGGQSLRLGTDKSLLELNGQSLLARTVHKLAALSDDVVVVTNKPEDYEHLSLEVRFVPDEQPGVGALMGVYSGLKATVHDSALTVGCDMPFLNVPLLRYMLPESASHDVVVPRLGEFLEPLHAIYGKQCLPFMEALLAQGRKQIIAFFDKVRVGYIEAEEIARFDPLHLSFLNVNEPADWQRAQELLIRAEPRLNRA
jgi:molybdopterin-guanine dinucleotide biosynthesis protein A